MSGNGTSVEISVESSLRREQFGGVETAGYEGES